MKYLSRNWTNYRSLSENVGQLWTVLNIDKLLPSSNVTIQNLIMRIVLV